jgi:hypothetical protein
LGVADGVDVLTTLGVEVVHIRDLDASEIHRLAAPARLVRGRLTYALAVPPDDQYLHR